MPFDQTPWQLENVAVGEKPVKLFGAVIPNPFPRGLEGLLALADVLDAEHLWRSKMRWNYSTILELDEFDGGCGSQGCAIGLMLIIGGAAFTEEKDTCTFFGITREERDYIFYGDFLMYGDKGPRLGPDSFWGSEQGREAMKHVTPGQVATVIRNFVNDKRARATTYASNNLFGGIV